MTGKRIAVWGVVLLSVCAGLLVFVNRVSATAPVTEGSLCGKSGPWVGPNGLIVKKDVFCEKTRTWNWTVDKQADVSSLTLAAGQQAQVNYTVVVNASAAESQFFVSGNVSYLNSTSQPITVMEVVDSLGPVDCGVTFPHVLPAGFSLNCTYGSALASAAPANVATVTDSNGVAVSATAPIDWSKATLTEIDECATVTDTLAGALGTLCAGVDALPKTFTYSHLVGAYTACGDYTVDNVASFSTNDSGATGSDSWTVGVTVPCAGGCTLTPGYWKTHSSYGPAPYDDTWALIGENTTFYSSGKSYYQVLWTPPSGGNAYYILAHAYIAAQLNQLNGANFSAAQTAFNQATALFANPANTPAAVGALRGSARNTWTNLATTLDNYNNGLIGPGHCSE